MFKNTCLIALMLISFSVYPMQEDSVLIKSPHIRLLPESNSASQGNATHSTREDILPRVDSLLVEQEAEDDFTHFTSVFTNNYGRSWREVVPFVRIERSLITGDHEVNPYRLTVEDFIAAGQPFFYSYDRASRPFIACIHKVANWAGYAVTLIYLHTVVECSWLMESTQLCGWDMLEREGRRDFTELAELLVHGQGPLRGSMCKLLSREEIMVEASRNSSVTTQEQDTFDTSLNQDTEPSISQEPAEQSEEDTEELEEKSSDEQQEVHTTAQNTKTGKRGFVCFPY